MSALPFVLIAQVVTAPAARAPEGGELIAFAAASPRPAECAGSVKSTALVGSERTLWDRARRPRLSAYCDALARGYSTLARTPADALAAAQRADKALPGRAAARVLQARAEVALGRHAAAWSHFAEARKISRRSIESPGALHDYAIAALKTDHRDEAVRAYRALAPRAGLLGDGLERQRVYLEAAAAVMTLGEAGLNEAIGYLSEARRKGSRPGFGDYILAGLALALDRSGRGEEARGVAAEAGGASHLALVTAEPSAASALAPRMTPVLPAGEVHALVAILAERDEPELARERWQAFLDGGGTKGVWADHARRRLEALRVPKPKRVKTR
jgi:tetratricopeptide (TPR) repeat protein